MNSFNHRNPLLLVHGINDTGAVFYKMAPYLTQLGWSVYDLDLIPSNGNIELARLAGQVAEYVAATFPPEQPFDLVGFSMGGIVSRYYVQRLGGINRVQRFITIASPHQGTWIAYGSQRPGCIQMRPGSAFLQDLNRDAAMLNELNFTSIWTPFDLMIVPANSSQMPVGQNVQVPVLGHSLMLTDSRSLAAVVAALSQPVKEESRGSRGRGGAGGAQESREAGGVELQKDSLDEKFSSTSPASPPPPAPPALLCQAHRQFVPRRIYQKSPQRDGNT